MSRYVKVECDHCKEPISNGLFLVGEVRFSVRRAQSGRPDDVLAEAEFKGREFAFLGCVLAEVGDLTRRLWEQVRVQEGGPSIEVPVEKATLTLTPPRASLDDATVAAP